MTFQDSREVTFPGQLARAGELRTSVKPESHHTKEALAYLVSTEEVEKTSRHVECRYKSLKKQGVSRYRISTLSA